MPSSEPLSLGKRKRTASTALSRTSSRYVRVRCAGTGATVNPDSNASALAGPLSPELLRDTAATGDAGARGLSTPSVADSDSRPGLEPECDLDLPALLDFTALTTTTAALASAVAARFDRLAHALLHEYVLVVRAPGASAEYVFAILELEFYLRSPSHADPFAHGSAEQRVSGNWYFHRAPRRSDDATRSETAAAGYRGGTRKGLDLTLGAPVSVRSPYFASSSSGSSSSPTPVADIRGGALLRSVQRISPPAGKGEKTLVSGPSLLVDEILRLSAAPAIAPLVRDTWGGDTSAFSPSSPSSSSPASAPPRAALFLRRRTAADGVPWEDERVATHRSPRIGLDLAHPGTAPSATHPRAVFVARPYRYFVRPELLVANGRGQTLLGLYTAFITENDGNEDEDEDEDEVCTRLAAMMGAKVALVRKYVAEYRAGLEKGRLESWVGAKGKGSAASPMTYLRMMGALARETAAQSG